MQALDRLCRLPVALASHREPLVVLLQLGSEALAILDREASGTIRGKVRETLCPTGAEEFRLGTHRGLPCVARTLGSRCRVL